MKSFRNARDRLRALVMGKAVAVEYRGQDRYGRPLVRLEIDGDDVGLRLVAVGLAWHFTRYSDDAGLAAAEVDARAAGRRVVGRPRAGRTVGMAGQRGRA